MTFGPRWAWNASSRHIRSSRGSGMRTGQTASQAPQNDEASGRCFDVSSPLKAGVSTDPTGPA